jgi:hypothetical protein
MEMPVKFIRASAVTLEKVVRAGIIPDWMRR